MLLHSGYASLDPWPAKLALALLSFLACVEKLSSVVNIISVERDWVVVISQNNTDDLQGGFKTLQPAARANSSRAKLSDASN
jgi:iron-regulated transporter 1